MTVSGKIRDTVTGKEFTLEDFTVETRVPNFVITAHLGAPIVATTNRIVTSVDFANATLTIANQPDTPRNLTATLTDANASVSAGTLTITGLSPNGNVISDAIGFAALVAGWTGTKIYASVTSAVITGATGGAAGTDVIVVGVGSVIGLPSDIAASAAVKHVYLAGARIASPTIAFGTNVSGVNVSASTYDGSKQLRVIYNPYQ